jgi:hypothetical protein
LIGGDYFIKLKPVEDSLLYSLTELCPAYAFFSSGRDALFSALTLSLRGLSAQRIWIPDFISKQLFDAIRQTGLDLHFYPITEQLLPREEWIGEVRPGDIVFVTHLFGIVQTALLTSLANTDAIVISDLTQKPYNPTGWQAIASQSAYIVSSLRTTMALPDGALLASQKHEIVSPKELPADDFWALRAAALLSRGGSANQGFMSDENSHLFKKAELWVDSNLAAARKMSDCSRALLATQSENDWETDRKQTHHNQAILATHLAERVSCPQVKPTRTLPEIAVSTFFPIVLESAQRAKLKAVLADQRIYCPIHWDTAFLSTPHPLSQKILSIPCDARYTNRDMKYIATIISAHV